MQSSLLGALVWFVISYGFAVAGYLGANVVASRWLGLAGFGYFVIAVTVTAVVGQLALLGAHRGGLRDAALLTGDHAPEADTTIELLRGDAAAATRLTLPAAAVVGAAAVFWLVESDLQERLALALGFAALIYLSGLQKLWANYLRGLGQTRLSSLLEGRSGGAAVSLLQAAALVAVWQLAPEAGLAGALAALVVGFIGPVVYAGWRVSRTWAHRPRARGLVGRLRSSVRRNWRFAANQLALYLAGAIEIWIAGVMLSSEDASLFSAAQRLALLLALPLTSLQVVFAPVITRSLAAQQSRRLEKVLRTGATLAAAGSAVLVVPIVLFPASSLQLVFGAEFAAADTVLLLLVVGLLVNVASGLCGITLTMSHHEGVVAAVQAGGVVLRTAAGLVAAAVWGLEGLAASASVLTAATYGVLWVQTRRRLGLWTHPTLRPRLDLLRRTSG